MGTPQVATVVASAAGATKVRWKIFLIMLFLISINYIDRASLSVAMPLIGKEFDMDPATQGLLLSSFFWTYAFMQVPGGMLADRFKPRIVIAAATLGWGFFQAIAAVCTGWVTLLLTRLGLGAAEAPIYPAGGKLNAIWMTQNERGRGATLLDGGAPLGAALGSIIIAGLIAWLNSWRLSFVVAGVGTVLAGSWCWYLYPQSPEGPSQRQRGGGALSGGGARPGRRPVARQSTGGNVMNFFRYRSVWAMCFGWMFFNTRLVRPAHLDAELPVQGSWLRHQAARRRHRSLSSSPGSSASWSAVISPTIGKPGAGLRTWFTALCSA